MAKKVFVSKTRVVKGDRWYLDYTRFDFETGKETRHRKDFDLNDIPDLEIREKVAERLARYLDEFIPVQTKQSSVFVATGNSETVQNAVDIAVLAKLNLPRKNSHKGYKSNSKTFLEWAKARGYANIPIRDFSRKHCRAFFDWLSGRRKYRAATLNNYLIHLKGLWYEMIDRELIAENPWSKIKPERKEEKLRRVFSDQERRIVASEVERLDYWLFRGLLLQFFGYIRPVELTRLKFKHFDLVRGVVTIEAWAAKKWKKRFVTLPASIMHYFKDGKFDQYPAHFYVLGVKERKILPSTEPAGDGMAYKRHRKILDDLVREKRLDSISGLTWYSWKDTGISLHAKRTTPLSTRDQAGHNDIKMTMVYYHQNEVIEEYRQLANDLY